MTVAVATEVSAPMVEILATIVSRTVAKAT